MLFAVMKITSVMISRPQSGSRKETLYRVYTRELDRELYTGLSTLYIKPQIKNY